MTRSGRVIAWIERHCRVPAGKDVGQPVRLRKFQREFLEKVYDNPNGTRRAILSVGRKNTKALALDTPIPTPNGWREMRDIRRGDFVFDPAGQPVRVVAESEVFTGKPCYRVSFSDGSSVVASEDHLWTTRHRYRPWAKTRKNGSGFGGRAVADTVTTAQIAESVCVSRCDGGLERNHKIDAAAALEMPDVSLSIDPYVLGAWLGDGTSACGTFTCSEDDLPTMVAEIEAGIGSVAVSRYGDRAPTIRTPGTGFQSALRELGVLNNKHVPAEYFDAGTSQRWALLQGLMDTDGSVARHSGKTTPRCTFAGTSDQLTQDVWRLARSLGLKATRKERRAMLDGKDCGPMWQVSFPASSWDPVFRLKRKQRLLPETLGKRSATLTITACEPVEPVDTKCIAVDSEDHLFLCGHGCIPTHNTATSAMLLLCHLVGPESVENSELYSAALSRDQAALLFNLAAKMVRMNPDLADAVMIRDTAKQLYCPERGTLYRALSADAPTAFGLSPAFIVHDELGQVKGPRHQLYEALETATGAYESPLSLVISTQAPTDGDLLSILIDDALEGHDVRTVVELHTAPTDADPFDIETVRRANPALGDMLSEREVMDMADAARRMPSREAEYRNLILNQRVDASSPFVTQTIWQMNGAEPSPSGPMYGGLDLSETADLTALVLVSPSRGTYHCAPTFWLPDDGLSDRSRQDRVPYDLWHQQGSLKTTPGASVEYEYVAQHIKSLFDEHDIRRMAFDRYNMRHLRPWLIKAGMSESLIDERFVNFGQGFVSMSPALRVLESLLVNGKIRHGNHPVLSMCAANAVVKADEAGNRKLDKKKSRGRIDGMVALAMACAVANEDQAGSKVYPVELEKLFA